MKTMIEKAKQYKRKVVGKYISITKEDINSKIVGDKIFITTKIDGEFNLLYYDGNKSILINSNGKIKDDLVILETISAILKNKKIKSITIACELHIKQDDKRCRVSEVISAIANEPKLLILSAFDILDIDGEEFIKNNYEQTIKKLTYIFDINDIINPVALCVLSSKEIENKYHEIVEINNAEGLIVRIDGMPIVYKIKPIHTIDMAVIGYTEGENNMIREVLLGLLNEDNNYIQVGRVGTGLNDKEKRNLFEILSKNKIDSSYIEADKKRVAFAMVKPTIVVEISVNELLNENSKGSIKNSLLKYDEDNGYSFISSINGTSLLHPIFKRIRNDKTINNHDIRYKQITDIVYINSSNHISSQELPKSEIIFREVYTKAVKGKINIQKFIAWRTNKEDVDTCYPAYVMNYTNFSPTRSETLKRDVRVSSSKEQILKLLQVFKDKNIKKGWSLINV